MRHEHLIDGRIMQTAYVTDDIERSVRTFGEKFGIGGWAIVKLVAFESMLLRGERCEARISAAIGFQGDMMYEFIQPLDDLPSVYRDPRSNRLSLGFHHLARVVCDWDATMARCGALGMTLAMDARAVGGGHTVYMEDQSGTGMVELLEWSPAVEAFVRGAAALEAPVDNGGVRITYW
jgi:Glyoxalase/Bleomycin resistance protein/Dioxygenase superfamily